MPQQRCHRLPIAGIRVAFENVIQHHGVSNESSSEMTTTPPMHIPSTAAVSKTTIYRQLCDQMSALFVGERDGLANAANTSALLYEALPNLNWAGFYFLQGRELVLGPFQGKVACVRIALGQGVCGTAAERRETVIVPDVHAFPGHIACDAASRSEIVLPLIQNGLLLGVLDLDSPQLARFDHEDRSGLTAAVDLLLLHTDFTRIADAVA
jgi:GAF domain-containing protein